MREYKFKALTLEGNVINDIGSVEFFTDGQIIVNDEIPVKQLIQYTGLKDRNGKEIYEGDVITMIVGYFKAKRNQKVVDHIVYDNGGFISEKYRMPIPAMSQAEVIGNIYEKPELISSDKPL